MPTSFLEIVELPDGRIELRRAEDEGSLVTLNFSEDAKAFLQGQHVEVAKAMLSVGVQMAGRLAEGELSKEEEGPLGLHWFCVAPAQDRHRRMCICRLLCPNEDRDIHLPVTRVR